MAVCYDRKFYHSTKSIIALSFRGWFHSGAIKHTYSTTCISFRQTFHATPPTQYCLQDLCINMASYSRYNFNNRPSYMLQLNNSTWQSLSLGAGSSSASQNISQISQKLMLHDNFHNSFPRARILSKVNPARQILKFSSVCTVIQQDGISHLALQYLLSLRNKVRTFTIS